MLFNSYQFIFVFLPIALVGFWLVSSFQKPSLVTVFFIIISLIFYSIWDLKFLILLLLSIVINWFIGEGLTRLRKNVLVAGNRPNLVKLLAISGISFNLLLLSYFKYSNFFIDTVNGFGLSLGHIEGLILPLGISFYTFEQISYLVGIASGKRKSHVFSHFLLFITFFPHLIAGPILNANELIPQFRKLNYRFDFRNLAIGFTVFAIGLFKKTVIADSVSGYATPVFISADQGELIGFFLAWQAAIAYSLQLYFDFSGYSDMAIGLSKMFNIKLPINFFSPYQAISIGDFWRRWHITLGKFLRDYLYIPLGGSRQGQVRHYVNLLITMLIGGLWHGANWTFIIWGGLHGIYLCIDHAWNSFLKQKGLKLDSAYHYWLARMLTFLAVVISWVLFRAETVSGASRILAGMFGGSGFIIPSNIDIQGYIILLVVLAGAFFLPNLYQFMIHEPVALDLYSHLTNQEPAWYAWRPTFGYTLLTFIIFAIGLAFCNQASSFLYFQF